jgi:hypothetical protein
MQASAYDKCRRCHGRLCCNYITQAIDTPRSKRDFEFLLWQLSHAGVRSYQDTDGWYLLIETRCQHLQADGRCGIYAARPWICREYDHTHCEYDEPAERHFKRYFPDYASLLTYCRSRFPRWDG